MKPWRSGHVSTYLHAGIAWEKLPPKSFSGTTLSLAIWDQWFQTIALCIHTFRIEWKPCAARVTDGHAGETRWQLWNGLEVHISPEYLCQTRSSIPFCRRKNLQPVTVATVGSKSIACIKLPHNARQSSIALNECIWCLGFGRLFDQVEILMDFSLPLTDEAGSGQNASSRWGHLNLVVAEQSAETQRANAAFTSVRQRGESGSLATVNPTRPRPHPHYPSPISDTLQDTPSGHSVTQTC